MANSSLGWISNFLGELKRRRVYRVTAIYVVLSVGGLELASVLLPSTRLPGWFDELFLGLAITGLPLVLVLAWTFDITESGIRRTTDLPKGSPGADDDLSRGGSPPAARAQQGDASERVVPSSATGATSATGGPPRRPEAIVPELDSLTVAVLPFENLSGATSAEPFALGLHDDLLTELSRASALTVISRTSVRGYLGTSKSLPEIARELGAGTIVEGGVQQAGNRVRLNVQLIDARTDKHLWAERYDRELTTENIFELQSELAAGIMAELHAQLTAEEAALPQNRPTADLEAYQLLVTGRQALIDRSHEGFEVAATLFERAVERDPTYAPAWAGLADALVGLVDYGHSDSSEALRRGADACRRALELDPNLAEAHAAWGRFLTAARDAPGSARAHARAIELQPSYAGAHQWSCWANLLLDRGEKALSFGEKATRLDPLDPEASGNLALACLMVGEPERALAETRRILALHPSFEYARWAQGLSLQALQRWEEAAEAFATLADRWTRGWPELGRAAAACLTGDEATARELLASLSGRETGFERGMILALLGERDEALGLLRSEWPLPWAETLYLYVHRAWPIDDWRSDERFRTFVDDVRASWRVEHA
jgi:TolB-like protein/Flp pilus assembly protein TadD